MTKKIPPQEELVMLTEEEIAQKAEEAAKVRRASYRREEAIRAAEESAKARAKTDEDFATGAFLARERKRLIDPFKNLKKPGQTL